MIKLIIAGVCSVVIVAWWFYTVGYDMGYIDGAHDERGRTDKPVPPNIGEMNEEETLG